MSERIAELPLDAFNGASNGGFNGNLNLKLPTGVTYREILLGLNNLKIEQVKRISLTLNGDEIVRVTGQELDDIRKSAGLHTRADVLVIPFTDVSQKYLVSQDWSELVTVAGENLVLKIETGDKLADGSQDNKVAEITARAKFAGMRAARTRLPRIFSDGMSGTRAGENRYSGLATQNKSSNPSRIQRIFVRTDRCKNLELQRDRQTIFDKSIDDNNFDLRTNKQVPPAAAYLYNAVQEGAAASDALGVTQHFEFIADLESAGDFNVLFQTVEVLQHPVSV